MQIQDIKIKQELQKIKEQVDYIYDEATHIDEVEKTSLIVSEKLEMLINVIDWEK